MAERSCDTPVLFLIFNRPDATARVFEEIRKARPKRLFVAADGPREDHPDDAAACAETRSIVRNIDWPCEVKSLLREKNLGCKVAVSSAIDWFFENADKGIILEDDCVPTHSFFGFCAAMLERYENDHSVMMVSGSNFLFGKYSDRNSYYFSNLPLIWGWATWKRAWDKYAVDVGGIDKSALEKKLKLRYPNPRISAWLGETIERSGRGLTDTWDAQLVYAVCANDGLVVMPYRNQVSNIGARGAHAGAQIRKDHFLRSPTREIDVERLIHPPSPSTIDRLAEKRAASMLLRYRFGGIRGRVSWRLKSVLRRFAPK